MSTLQRTGALLAPIDRLTFERQLQWLRLSFLSATPLVLAAMGRSAIPFALGIAVATLASYGWVELLLRRAPEKLMKSQLRLRALDCGLVFLVLHGYHGFLGDAYYDSVYLLFVLAAGATHGAVGACVLAAVGGTLVLSSRLLLIIGGNFLPEPRHLTDAAFYTVFFGAVGLAVALLMRRSAQVAAEQEQAYQADLALRNEELERLAAENAQMFERASRALQASREALGAAAHDLKNPLVAIRAYAQLLQGEASRETTISSSRRSERLGRIQEAADRMTALANELGEIALLELEVSRPLSLSETDLVALVRRCALSELQPEDAARVKVVAPGEGTVVGQVDAPILERVVANLLHNAARYSLNGEVITVTIEAPVGRGMRIVVADQGLGIPAEDLPHVFERYRRGSNVADRIEGSGIGLATCREGIEGHGGTIEVDSREGEGTRVSVWLPLAPRGASAVGAAVEPTAA